MRKIGIILSILALGVCVLPSRCETAEPTLDEQIATVRKQISDLQVRLDALIAARALRDKAVDPPVVTTAVKPVAPTVVQVAVPDGWKLVPDYQPPVTYSVPNYTYASSPVYYTSQAGSCGSSGFGADPNSGACSSSGSDSGASAGGRCGPIRRLLGRCK